MTDNTFASTGVLARMQPGARITRFQVLGERSSGTNFTKRLLGRNSDLRPTEALGWKHGFPHAGAIPPDLVVIGVVRRADEWARSMHARPWHCSAEMQRLGFSAFIRAEWDTYVDRPQYFGRTLDTGSVGQPLQHDRHPLTGRRFANIFALRQAKLDGLRSYQNRGCSFVLLRMETVTGDPEGTLDQLLHVLGQPARSGAFRPVVKRLGTRFRAATETRPAPPEQMSENDLEFLRNTVNAAQEAALGYTY